MTPSLAEPEQLSLIDPDPPCVCCGRPAPWLCDYAIGFKGEHCAEGKPAMPGTLGPSGVRLYIDPDLEAYTCDAPLCDGCTRKVGPLFDFPKRGEFTWDDHCPAHAHKDILDSDWGPMTEYDANAKRQQIHGRLRRVTVMAR